MSLSRSSASKYTIARRCIPAGISSDSSSRSSSPLVLRWMGVQVSAIEAGEPRFAARLGESPDPQNIGGALGHADRAARVEQIEQMTGLEALVVSGQCHVAVD